MIHPSWKFKWFLLNIFTQNRKLHDKAKIGNQGSFSAWAQPMTGSVTTWCLLSLAEPISTGLFQVLRRVAIVMIAVKVMKIHENYANISILTNFVLNVVPYGCSNAKSRSVQTVFWHTQKTKHKEKNNKKLGTHGPLVIRDVGHSWLRWTHWGRDKMDAISQTTYSTPFSCMKMFELRLKFHLNLFLRV